jgi:hypothetical protein
VSPHQVSFNKIVNISAADITAGAGLRALKFNLNPDKLLQIAANDTQTLENATNVVNVDNAYANAGARVYFNAALHYANGANMEPIDINGADSSVEPGFYFSEHNDKLITRFGVMAFPVYLKSTTNLYQSIDLQNGGAHDVTFILGCADGQGNKISEITHTATTANGYLKYDWATDANIDGFYTSSASAAYTYFAYSGASPLQIGQLAVETRDTVVSGDVTWADYSLWDLVAGSDALKRQFLEAQLYNPTGLRVLIQNTTPNMAEGGNIYGARLPAYAESTVPGTFDGILALISCQKHHKLQSNKIKDGGNYFYTPEKIQDYFFVRPVEAQSRNSWPFGLCLLDPSQLSDSGCNLNLNVTFSYELITTDVSATMFCSASSEVLMNQLLYALSKENGWSENPNHLQHAAKAIKRVMTSDEMKFALSSLVRAGVKIAPMVISALV